MNPDSLRREQVSGLRNNLSDHFDGERHSDGQKRVAVLPVCKDSNQFGFSEAVSPNSTSAHSGRMRSSLVVTAEWHDVATLEIQEKVRRRVHSQADVAFC